MAGYLIKDTTKEEREHIVAESLGYMEANCDGCTSGLAEMYQAYIDGKKELRDINMEFHAGYVSGEEVCCPLYRLRSGKVRRANALFFMGNTHQKKRIP